MSSQVVRGSVRIYREGAKLVAAGHNSMDIKRGIDRAVEDVVQSLKAMSKPTKDPKEIAQVGAISANGDQEIGNKLAEAMEKVGKEGVIAVEESKTAETTLEIVEGMQFDRGISRHTSSRTPSAWKRVSTTPMCS